jgi:hypothetical protein
VPRRGTLEIGVGERLRRGEALRVRILSSRRSPAAWSCHRRSADRRARRTRKQTSKEVGVFDFDAVIFHDLWEKRTGTEFNDYTIWAISDHRPLWAQLKAP